MPGPMSVPNGSSRSYKFVEDQVEQWVPMHRLTGEERAYLARRRRLDTGKTAKKKARK